MYAIYLPNDTEKWFNVTFKKESRALWFAEINNLEPDDYEVRLTTAPIVVVSNAVTEERAVA